MEAGNVASLDYLHIVVTDLIVGLPCHNILGPTQDIFFVNYSSVLTVYMMYQSILGNKHVRCTAIITQIQKCLALRERC